MVIVIGCQKKSPKEYDYSKHEFTDTETSILATGALKDIRVSWNDNGESDLNSYTVSVWDTLKVNPIPDSVSFTEFWLIGKKVEWYSDLDFGNIVNIPGVTESQFVWKNLEEGLTYKFAASAVDNAGNASWATSITWFIFDFPPSPPTGLKLELILIVLGASILIIGLIILIANRK